MAMFGAPTTARVTGARTGAAPGMFLATTTMLPFSVVVPKSPASIVTVKSMKLSGPWGGEGWMVAELGTTLSHGMTPLNSALTSTRSLPPRFTTCRVRVVDDPVSRVAPNDSGLTIISGGGDDVPRTRIGTTGAFAASLVTVRLESRTPEAGGR